MLPHMQSANPHAKEALDTCNDRLQWPTWQALHLALAPQPTHRMVRNRPPLRRSCSRHDSTAGGSCTMKRRSGATSSSRSTVCAYLRGGAAASRPAGVLW